jgi:hypothetical protein
VLPPVAQVVGVGEPPRQVPQPNPGLVDLSQPDQAVDVEPVTEVPRVDHRLLIARASRSVSDRRSVTKVPKAGPRLLLIYAHQDAQDVAPAGPRTLIAFSLTTWPAMARTTNMTPPARTVRIGTRAARQELSVVVCNTVLNMSARFDVELLDDESPFEIDRQAAHLFKHPYLGIDDVMDIWNSDPLLYPARPPAHWLMVAEVAGQVLMAPLAPANFGDPRR